MVSAEYVRYKKCCLKIQVSFTAKTMIIICIDEIMQIVYNIVLEI